MTHRHRLTVSVSLIHIVVILNQNKYINKMTFWSLQVFGHQPNSTRQIKNLTWSLLVQSQGFTRAILRWTWRLWQSIPSVFSYFHQNLNLWSRYQRFMHHRTISDGGLQPAGSHLSFSQSWKESWSCGSIRFSLDINTFTSTFLNCSHIVSPPMGVV